MAVVSRPDPKLGIEKFIGDLCTPPHSHAVAKSCQRAFSQDARELFEKEN
jgi:hypothetical protein